MTRVVNLTPHAVNIIDNGVITHQFPPERESARCFEQRIIDGWVNKDPPIKITSVRYGPVTGLPAPEHGTLYIVSMLVAQALPSRGDLLFPGEVVREVETGKIIGCTSLSYFQQEIE